MRQGQSPSGPAAIPSRRDIFTLAWPLALNAVMLQSIVVIDALLVSALGESALAAMGLASGVAGLMIGMIFACSNATQILIAQAFGAGEPVALKSTFWCGLAINLVCALFGVLLITLFGGGIVARFAHTPEIAADAQRYLSIFAFVIIGEAVAQAVSCFFNGSGRTRLPFTSYLIALPLNVALSAMLIHGLAGAPELGVMGAAVGSAVAAIVRAAYLGWWMQRLTDRYRDVIGWANGSFLAALRKHFVFALPIATTFTSVALTNSVCVLLYAKLSINQFAAMTLILPWVDIAGKLMITWTQAGGILVGQLLGRRVSNGMIDTFLWRSWSSAMGAGTLVATAYLAICLSFPWIYGDLQPETLATLSSFLPVLLIMTFPKCSNAVCGNTLRAGGDTVYVMNIFLFAQWLVRVPLTALFILVFHLPATWVFAIFLIDELAKFPLFHLRLRAGKWKRSLVAS